MFVYHGYDVKDVILSNETAEGAVSDKLSAML